MIGAVCAFLATQKVWFHSKLIQSIKGATFRKLQMEYKELNKQFWENICGQEDALWQIVEM